MTDRHSKRAVLRNRNFKRPFSSNKKVAKPSPGGKQQSPPSEMREFILRGGLTGSLFLARAGLSIHCGCGLGNWAKGICRLQALNRNPVGRLGCLQ